MWAEVLERWEFNTAHDNVQSTKYKLSKLPYFQTQDQPSQLHNSHLATNSKGLVLCEKKFILFSTQHSFALQAISANFLLHPVVTMTDKFYTHYVTINS